MKMRTHPEAQDQQQKNLHGVRYSPPPAAGVRACESGMRVLIKTEK